MKFETKTIDVLYDDSLYGVEALCLQDFAVHGAFNPANTWLSKTCFAVTYTGKLATYSTGKQIMFAQSGKGCKRIAIRYALILQELIALHPEWCRYTTFNIQRAADDIYDTRYAK